MNFRPMATVDAAGLLAVWNSAAQFDPLTPTLLEEKVWGDGDFDPDLALVAEERGDLRGLAVAVVRSTGDDCRAFVKLAAVAPPWQRCGLGSRLLAAVETRATERGAAEIRLGESAPNYLTPGVDVRYQSASTFFCKQGYTRFAQATNLSIDLKQWQRSDGAADRQPPNRQTLLRRAKPSDWQSVRQLIDEHWPSWWGEVSQTFANDPVSLFLAFEADRPIGFAAYDANNRGTGWFGPMGTSPLHRGRGLGRALLTATLRDMADRGYLKAIIPWVGPVDFYTRQAGASISRRFDRFRKTLH